MRYGIVEMQHRTHQRVWSAKDRIYLSVAQDDEWKDTWWCGLTAGVTKSTPGVCLLLGLLYHSLDVWTPFQLGHFEQVSAQLTSKLHVATGSTREKERTQSPPSFCGACVQFVT